MRKIKYLFPLLVILTLAGCGDEVVEPEPTPTPVVYKHTQAASTTWRDMTISGITPCCAFDSTQDLLTVYPYFDSDYSVRVGTILISENDFWKASTRDLEKGNVFTSGEYSYATLPNGNTIGYKEIDEETAYWVISTDLPSAYVQAVLKQLCQ